MTTGKTRLDTMTPDQHVTDIEQDARFYLVHNMSSIPEGGYAELKDLYYSIRKNADNLQSMVFDQEKAVTTTQYTPCVRLTWEETASALITVQVCSNRGCRYYNFLVATHGSTDNTRDGFTYSQIFESGWLYSNDLNYPVPPTKFDIDVNGGPRWLEFGIKALSADPDIKFKSAIVTTATGKLKTLEASSNTPYSLAVRKYRQSLPVLTDADGDVHISSGIYLNDIKGTTPVNVEPPFVLASTIQSLGVVLKDPAATKKWGLSVDQEMFCIKEDLSDSKQYFTIDRATGYVGVGKDSKSPDNALEVSDSSKEYQIKVRGTDEKAGIEFRKDNNNLLGTIQFDANGVKINGQRIDTTPETAESVRDLLTTLQGDERLDAAAIKNIPTASDITGAQIVSKLDTELGQTFWKSDQEAVQDMTAAMFVNGQHQNITVSYNDAAGVINLTASDSSGSFDGLDTDVIFLSAKSKLVVANGKLNTPYKTLTDAFNNLGSRTEIWILDNDTYSDNIDFSTRGRDVYIFGPFARLTGNMTFGASPYVLYAELFEISGIVDKPASLRGFFRRNGKQYAATGFGPTVSDDFAIGHDTTMSLTSAFQRIAALEGSVPSTMKFTNLQDTPDSYTGHRYEYPRVNVAESGLEFHKLTLDDIDDVNVDGALVGDILMFTNGGWQAEIPREQIAYQAITTSGIVGDFGADKPIHILYVNDNNNVDMPMPGGAVDKDLCIVKNYNSFFGRNVNLSAPLGYTINGSATPYSVPARGTIAYLVFDEPNKNWIVGHVEKHINNIGTLTGDVTDSQAETYIAGLGFTKSTATTSPITITQTGSSDPSSTVVNPHTIEFTGALVEKDEDDPQKAIIAISTGGTAGVEIDDGTTDAASVTKINLKGAKITGVPNTGNFGVGEAQVTAGLNIHMMAPDTQYGSALATEVVVEPPLTTYIDPNITGAEAVRLGIKHGTFEPLHKPSYLAYLKEEETVVGKVTDINTKKSHNDGILYFDDVIVPEGSYIEVDRTNKKYGIQEADTLDPNVSGGTDYLIAFRVGMKGTAPEDGFVRAYLYNNSINPFEPKGYLEDVDGSPMAVERQYKAGEKLGVLDVLGIVNAKGLQEFTCHVVDSFTSDAILLEDPTEEPTGLMIQALTSEGSTGLGRVQFELDTQQNLNFSKHYLGPSRFTMAYQLSQDVPVTAYTGGSHAISVDGTRAINPNGIKYSIQSNHLILQDDGVHICDFNLGKIFSAEETYMMRGKEITATFTLIDKDSAFNVALVKWTGKPDAYTPEIFLTRNNDSPVLQTNWSIVDTLFISEDAVAGDHTASKDFTIPVDANNYAVIIYPAVAQTPLTLKLKQFDVDVKVPFNGYVLKAPELLNELHLEFDERTKTFVQDTQGYAALRYTINDSEVAAPCGVPSKGTADITIDTTVNQVNGSSAKGGEGALVFNADGTATIYTELLLWSEQAAGTSSEVTFWWAKVVGSPGAETFDEIALSEFQVQVVGGAAGVQYHMPKFQVQVNDGDRLALRMQADKADGAFLQCNNNARPLVKTSVTFDELIPVEGDTTDLVSSPYERKLVVDNRVIPFTGITAQNYTFNIDIPSGVEIGSHSVVGVSGTNVVSIDNSEFSYNTISKELTVHVGTATDGKIYLTLWG